MREDLLLRPLYAFLLMVPKHRGIDPYFDISAAGAQCIAISRKQCLFLNRQLNN